jgi:hypothetical protein
MGPDLFLTHIRNAIAAGQFDQGDPEAQDVVMQAALRVFALGVVSPIVDSFTGDVLGFQFAMVARKHAEARKPTVTGEPAAGDE